MYQSILQEVQMKKLILELSQGSVHLGAWTLGSDPLNIRIIDDEEVLFELAMRTPPQKTSSIRFGRQHGDDFTMPLPMGEEPEQNSESNHFLSSSSPFDLSQQLPLSNSSIESKEFISSGNMDHDEPKFVPEELSFEMSASLMFGEDFEMKVPEEDEPVIDFEALADSPIVDETIDYLIPEPSEILDSLRASIHGISDSRDSNSDVMDMPPDIPALPGFDNIDIAVWKQVGGQWTCIERLQANEEFIFHGVKVWVDNNAALLLTGSSDILILVQHTDEREEEIQGINGALELPSRAIVLLQKDHESVCFRPE